MRKRPIKRSFLTVACIWGICAGLLLIISMGVIMFEAARPESYYMYEVTDPSQYGIYSGTGDNEFVREYIGSFFPKYLDESFSEVVYSYRAKSRDTYAFEAYLEFVIKDSDLFAQYIDQIGDVEWKQFAFDDQYLEYTLSGKLDLRISAASTSEETVYAIEQAKLGRILYDPLEQRIIYVAIGVYDGGGVDTNELNVFFDRFHIDPSKMIQP